MAQIDFLLPDLWHDLPVGAFLMTMEPIPRFIAANKAAVNLYGYENEATMLGVSIPSVFADPEDMQRICSGLQADGKVSNMLSRLKKINGSATFWAILDVSCVTDKNGAPCGLAVISNTTDEKYPTDLPEGEEWEGLSIFDTIAGLTFVTDKNKQIIYCNKAMISRLGVSYQEIKGKHVHAVFFDDQPPYTDPFREGSREVYIPEFDAHFLIKNNNIQTTELMLHVMLDITEQKKMGTLSPESEKYYRPMIAEKLPIGVYIEQEGCFQWVNSSFTRNTGYSPGEVLGRPCHLLVEPDDRENLRKNAIAMLRGETNMPYEYRFITKNNVAIWCMETVVSIMFQGKRAVLGTQMDLSGQKMAEEALRISEERYRTIIETMPDAYFEVDLAGKYIFCNDQYLKNTGYTGDEIKNIDLKDITDKKNAALAFKICNEVYKTGKPAMHVQLEWFNKAGQLQVAELSISLLRDFHGVPVGFRGISRDITEKRQQEVLAFHSRKLESVGQLAAGIAHEINTPIQFVGDNIHFMQNAFGDILTVLSMLDIPPNPDSAGPLHLNSLIGRVQQKKEEIDFEYLREEIPKAIVQSLDGLQRVSKIVQAMREFSHPGGENMSDLDINKSIESTVILTRNEWKYLADLVTDLAPNLPLVKGYQADFNQVILNIIVNAAQAVAEKAEKGSLEKGRIEISTRQDGNEIEVCIRDNGLGIPPDIQARVFDPFFTTKEVGKGTGQGLAIAQNIIVRKHGGKIYFDTQSGAGTAFYIRLAAVSFPK